MSINVFPEWLSSLDDEDLAFIKKFVLCSGSLKDMAKLYEVTYPTVRLRLDKLINKIKLNDKEENEPYISLIKNMALDEKIDIDTAKILIAEYKKVREK
ncbi:DUF2089 family protein [Wukongibacter sp. M2B1]|uniref:DUF2089 family protein n=1 Tax=Wukongibacter sp. M2B1 TaxID=3088895 RepID=UPI003D78D5CC